MAEVIVAIWCLTFACLFCLGMMNTGNQVYLKTQQAARRENLAQQLLERNTGLEYEEVHGYTGSLAGGYTYAVDVNTPSTIPMLGPGGGAVSSSICAKTKRVKVSVTSGDGRTTTLWGNRAKQAELDGATLYTTKYACVSCHTLQYGTTTVVNVSDAGYAPPHTGLKKRIMTQRLTPARPANSTDPTDLADAATYIKQSISTPEAYVVYSWEPLMGGQPAITDMSDAEQTALCDWLLTVTDGNDCPPLPAPPVMLSTARIRIPATLLLRL